jgi:hypothetical protein
MPPWKRSAYPGTQRLASGVDNAAVLKLKLAK